MDPKWICQAENGNSRKNISHFLVYNVHVVSRHKRVCIILYLHFACLFDCLPFLQHKFSGQSLHLCYKYYAILLTNAVQYAINAIFLLKQLEKSSRPIKEALCPSQQVK